MGVSRVNFGGETLVDLTEDTVTPQSLLRGYSAHNKAGELIQGLAVIPTKVSQLENDESYIRENEINDLTPTFVQSETRTNIESGEKLSVLFGKIKKWFADLKTVAFTGKYSDLTEKLPLINHYLTTEEGLGAADAKAMADLKKQIDSLNSDFANSINKINSNLKNLFKEVSGTATNDSIPSAELTSMNISLNIPSGYKIHSIKQLYITGWSGLVYQGHRISGNTLIVQVYNIRTTAKPCTVTAYVNCIKTI